MTEIKKRSLLSKISLLAGILGLPAFFIIFFSMGKQKFEHLKYYGDHTVITKTIDGKEVKDTIHYKVPGFHFKDHQNKLITEKDFENKILVINYIYADCPSDFCPIDFQSFKLFVGDEIVKNNGFKDVEIISLFVGKNDTLSEMNAFIKHYGINTSRWHFVSGDMGQFYNTDMLTQNPWTESGEEYGVDKVAQIMTLLIDRDLHIRGKFVTSKTSENKRITKEISILLREEKENHEKK